MSGRKNTALGISSFRGAKQQWGGFYGIVPLFFIPKTREVELFIEKPTDKLPMMLNILSASKQKNLEINTDSFLTGFLGDFKILNKKSNLLREIAFRN